VARFLYTTLGSSRPCQCHGERHSYILFQIWEHKFPRIGILIELLVVVSIRGFIGGGAPVEPVHHYLPVVL
jgi:hypothetical protein